MRSWFVGMPGEVVSCAGCHEGRGAAVSPKFTTASTRPLSEIEPWHAPVHGFSFPADVQPVLDRRCVACHDGTARADGTALIDLRGDEYITDWSSQISGNCGPQKGGNFSVSYANLHRFVRRPGIESDLRMLTPGEFHADTAELVQILRDGRHHNVTLDRDAWDSLITWIDLNTPFHGTWSGVAPYARDQVAKVNDRRIELSTLYASISTDFEAQPYRPKRLGESVLPGAAPKPPSDPVTVEGWPFGPDEARRRQAAAADAEMTVELGDGVQMKLVRIPAGEFVTGAVPRAASASQDLWLGACEVTNEQFRRFDPAHDSRHESRHGYQFGRVGYPMRAPKAPVLRVSWDQAMAFCEWLSNETGRRFALPAEDEWEYACRAGSDTAFSFGGSEADYTAFANLGDLRLKEFAACTARGNYTEAVVLSNPNKYDDWVPKDTRFDDGTFLTAEVGSYEPNAWGLHDMHGNVWEWTASERTEGRKVVRGGSWYDRPHRCTSDAWLDYRPYHKVFNVGFRVVCRAG
jgi:formylglycine-generating enzyme required for sulfatase activity